MGSLGVLGPQIFHLHYKISVTHTNYLPPLIGLFSAIAVGVYVWQVSFDIQLHI